MQANLRCSGTKELLTTITGSNSAVVDLDNTLGRLALDMSTHDELLYGLQCYLGMVDFRKEAAQQEKELKVIKDKKMKVQAAIQGEKVRITGKKRDDLQRVMSMLKEEEIDTPLQYNNFRD